MRILFPRIMPIAQNANVLAPPAIIVCACAAILLPAHPSIQYILGFYGVPSPIVSIIFTAPLLFYFVVRRPLNFKILGSLAPFICYILWMIVRGIFSPALGEENFNQSIRGLAILAPLSIFCALIASMNPYFAARAIFVFGIIAASHFVFRLYVGGLSEGVIGFRSLSDDSDNENYQSTAFYIGLAGLMFMSIAVRNRGVSSVIGSFLLLIIIALMGLVGARASLVALLASACAVMIISEFRQSAKTLLVIIGLLLIFAVFVLYFEIIDIESVQDQFIVIDRFFSLVEDDDSSRRVFLFSSAIMMWLDSPDNLLIGGGLASFPIYIGESNNVGWYPHNFILESLAEGGLVAGLLLALTSIRLVTGLFKIRFRNSNQFGVYIAASAVYSIIAYQFMGGIQTIWIPTFFVFLFLFSNLRVKK